MGSEQKGAAVPNAEATAPDLLGQKRAEKITARRADIPRIYRATYDRAVSGKSLRAAVNSFCLECVMWQRKEVTICTSLACPLYAVRPYQGPKSASERPDLRAESTNSENTG